MTTWADALLEQAGSPEVVRRARASLHVKGPGGQTVAHCVGRALHYQEGGDWQPIDPALRTLPSGRWGGLGTPVSLGADGTVYVDGSAYSHLTTRVGILTPSTMSFASVLSVPVGARSGASLVATGTVGGAGWQVERRLTENGYAEELTLASRPNVSAKAGDYLVLESLVAGLALPDGDVPEFGVGGLVAPFPVAVDATGSGTPARRYARTTGGQVRLYTGIPVGWLATAQYPITIDPDLTAGAADGYVYATTSTYALARAGASNYNNTATPLLVGQALAGTYSIYRGVLPFDTSSIGAGSTVTQAKLDLVVTTDSSTTDFDVQIRKYNFGTWGGSAATDYLALVGATLDQVWRNTSGLAINTQYASPNLDTSWIAKTGTTKYGLVSSRDVAATSPSGSENIRIATSENTTAGYRPVLAVTYAASARPKSWVALVG